MTSTSKENNMAVVKEIEICSSQFRWVMAGTPLSKLSCESLICGSDTVLIELRKKSCHENTLS